MAADDSAAVQRTSTELQVASAATAEEHSLTIQGAIPNLHEDPQKVRQLLDLLELPEGTEVRVVTTATSVLVR